MATEKDDEKVHIETTREARKRLKIWKATHGELTYTEALRELMDAYPEGEADGD